MAREDIVKKTYICIDEVYPEANTQDVVAFPIEEFLDQAAKIIIRIVPSRVLADYVRELKDSDTITISDKGNGIWRIKLPNNFIRFISFKATDWAHSVNTVLDNTSSLYEQQWNSVLRGTPYRPIVFLVDGGKYLEIYSSKANSNNVIDSLLAVDFDYVDDYYPTKLEDITAWKTAELVLSTMNDVSAAQICQSKVQEILETL